MKRSTPVRALVVTAAFALVVSGCGDKDSDGGTSSGKTAADGSFAVDTGKCPSTATTAVGDGDPIKIGTVMPLSGQYAVVGTPVSAGIKVAFAKANDAGGVDGHELELVAKDDAYDPTKTLPQMTELTQQDHVFATLGQIGTPNVAAAQPLAEQSCTPQLWVGSGAPQYGDPAQHPWTTTGFMSYSTEAQAWADYISKTKPGAKVAYLELDTDLGKAYSTSFETAAKDAGLTVVASEKTSPTATTVTNEVTNLLAAKPDVVILMSFVPSCAKAMGALAQGGYSGTTIAAYACASDSIFPVLGAAADGALTLAINHAPTDTSDADVSEFLADVKQYGDGVKPDGDVLTGYRLGDLLVQNLEAAAKLDGGLTPANAMNAAWSLDGTWFAAFGGKAHVDGEKDAYALEDGQMLSFDGATGEFKPVGDPIDREGQTGAYQG